MGEYWTVFPERPVFERKIHTPLGSAREQLARRKSLLPGKKKVSEARFPRSLGASCERAQNW